MAKGYPTGYPIDAQQALWKQYNEVLELLLSKFKGGNYNNIKEFRQAVFFDLLQNWGSEYQTHADVLTTTVFDNIEQRRFNVLNLDTVVEYLNQSFEVWKFFKPDPRKVGYTPIHSSASSINSFVKKSLIPFVKVLNGTVDANIEIPTDFGIDGTPEQQKAVNKLYKDLRKFAKDNPNINLADVKYEFYANAVKFKQNPDLQGASYDAVFSELIDEFHEFELQAMFSIVPGTEGIRPALNIATSVYESIDDVWETLDDATKKDLADLFDLLEFDATTSTVKKSNYAPENYKVFIKDKITEFLTEFSNNANQYIDGTEGFVESNAVFNNDYTKRGGGIRRAFREVFKREFLETNKYPIDILLNKSSDPIGFLQSIDDAHRAMQVDKYNAPYVGEKVVKKIQEIAGLKIEGVQPVGGFLGMKFAGMTVQEVAGEVFDYPQRPDFADLNPMFKKLEKYTAPVDNLGGIDINIVEEAGNVIELEDDVTIYHSRPESQGPLATDANFHAGTYQAALDRASFRYAGKSINEMLYETITELNSQINAELANIEMGEDYSTRISAQIGIGDNIATIEADIEWSAFSEELTIHLSDDQDYFQRYPEYSEGFGADDYGYSPTDTLDTIAGEIEISDYIDPDSLTKELPFGTGADFAWADGYKLYEITIPKDAKVLSLDKPITVEQKGQTVKLTGDRLQEAIEKGINQPGSDTVYQGVDSVTIGNKKIDIPAGLDKKEIEELLFGEYDVIAYKNDIEDVGSISYIVKPKYASAVRELTGNEKRLFNNRVIREYVGGNPSLFKGSIYDIKRKLNTLLGQITDPARKNDANIILEYYQKFVTEPTGIENSPEYSALTRLMSGTYDDTPTNVVDDVQTAWDSIGYDKLSEIQYGDKRKGHFEFVQKLGEKYSLTAQQKEDIINLILDEQEGTRGSLIPDADFAKAKNNIATYIQNNVLDKIQNQDLKVSEMELGKPFQYVTLNNPTPVGTLVIDGSLHARPTSALAKILQESPEDLYFKGPQGMLEPSVINLWKLPKNKKLMIELFVDIGQDAKNAFDYLNEKQGIIWEDEFQSGETLKLDFNKYVDNADLVDELETAIARTDGLDALNKSKDIINKNPRIFGKILRVLEKFDVGDQVIQQVIKRALPRIGLGAVAGPIGIAYAIYETSLLLADAASAAYKAETTDEGFWENFGEISDKYSIAYKITKPTYELLLDAVKADLEDNNTLYSFSR